ncbi:disease resistance protein RPV1-like [Vitis riparia]|uniref:disease resistance protein RPV1-like n=1 Tax=Vitis riparia TaxID=96939 RepID=UPI00155AE414|nr:disease resistance protein RPV1-like [Vitis riparia]
MSDELASTLASFQEFMAGVSRRLDQIESSRQDPHPAGMVTDETIPHAQEGKECMKSRGQRVLPIFYNVDPSDVRKQRGKIGEAFAKHEENLENMERVKVWREAVTQVSNLSGWDSRNK